MTSFINLGKTALNCLVLLAVVGSLLGCASINRQLKSLLGSKDKNSSQRAIASVPKERKVIRYSENPNVQFNSRRNYQRMTKEKFEDEANLGGKAGSLWISEGQGAYWFSQNQMRMVGDLLNVRLVNPAKDQLETKVKVIKKLLRRLERQEGGGSRRLASTKKKKAGSEGEKAAEQAQTQTPAPAAPAKKEKESSLAVKEVPTRIVEKLADGNYRVQGAQPFMIGQREYRVIVTGVIRAEDFNEDGVESAKLMEPKYDIVSNRRSFVQ